MVSLDLPIYFQSYAQHMNEAGFRFIFLHIFNLFIIVIIIVSLQCFDAVGWAAGRASGL